MQHLADGRQYEQPIVLTTAESKTFDDAEDRAHLTHRAPDYHGLLYQPNILRLNCAIENLALHRKGD